MAGKTVRLFTLSILLAAGGLDAAAETAGPTESVTVTSTRRAFHEFAKTFATGTIVTGKIARWEHRLCPIVVGQTPNYTRYLSQRVQVIATAVGAPVDTDPACKPNIDIIFTTTPQALLDTVGRDNQNYLGYFSTVAEKNALATVSRPIQAWYATESTDLCGRRRLDLGRSIVANTTVQNFNGMTGPIGDSGTNSAGSALTDMAPFYCTTGNHLNDGIHAGFNHVLIVIDSAKLAGQNMVPLADYIAMMALTQLNAPDACQDLPSVANRMAHDCNQVADGLTKYDMAYLEGLYHMTRGRGMLAQRSEIGDLMTDRLEQIK